MSPMASIDYITIESELGKNFVSRNFPQKKIKKFRRKKNYFRTLISRNFLKIFQILMLDVAVEYKEPFIADIVGDFLIL